MSWTCRQGFVPCSCELVFLWDVHNMNTCTIQDPPAGSILHMCISSACSVKKTAVPVLRETKKKNIWQPVIFRIHTHRFESIHPTILTFPFPVLHVFLLSHEQCDLLSTAVWLTRQHLQTDGALAKTLSAIQLCSIKQHLTITGVEFECVWFAWMYDSTPREISMCFTMLWSI